MFCCMGISNQFRENNCTLQPFDNILMPSVFNKIAFFVITIKKYTID